MSFLRHLDPTNDIAFKHVFGHEDRKNVLIKFLNDLLEKKSGERIVSVEFLNPSLPVEIASEKQSIVDVFVCDEKGSRYIVEVQVNARPGFEKRAQFYASKAYADQPKKGEDYTTLRPVIFIAILNFNMPSRVKDKDCVSTHYILNKKTYTHDLKDLSFIFVELRKFKKTLEELKTDEDRWIFFLRWGDKHELMKELIATSNPIFQEAYEALDAHNWSEGEVYLYEQQEKRLMDERVSLKGALEDGEKKGESKGRKEGLKEGLKQGLKKGLEKGLEEGIKRGLAEGEKQGREKGLAEGLEEGERKAQIKIAQVALKKGLDVKTVAALTGLSAKAIQAL